MTQSDEKFELIVSKSGHVTRYQGQSYIDSRSNDPFSFCLKAREIWPAKLARMSRRRRRICLQNRVEHSLSSLLDQIQSEKSFVKDSTELRELLSETARQHLPKIEVYVDTEGDAAWQSKQCYRRPT